jgi:hypothetical protein
VVKVTVQCAQAVVAISYGIVIPAYRDSQHDRRLHDGFECHIFFMATPLFLDPVLSLYFVVTLRRWW